MSQAPKENRDTFYKWVNAPIILLTVPIILGAIFSGHVPSIPITAPMSIGATILITAIIFVAMMGSFYLGMCFLPLSLANIILKTKMPWWHRVAGTIMMPFLMLVNKILERRYSAYPEAKSALTKKLEQTSKSEG